MIKRDTTDDGVYILWKLAGEGFHGHAFTQSTKPFTRLER